MIIGVDVGYGYTKAVAENGERVLFPSVVGAGFQRKMEKMMFDHATESDNYDLIIDKDEREHYFVGNLAILQSSNATRPFSDERTGVNEIKPQLLTAVGALCREEPVTLVTGLPLRPFFKQAPALKNSLERLSGVKIILNGAPVNIVFEKVVMFPQAMAALYGRLLRNKIGANEIIGLIDVGFKTTDIILFDASNRKVLEEFNDTIFAGMNNIIMGVQNEIGQDAGITPNPEWVEQAIIKDQLLFFNKKEYDVAKMAVEQEKALRDIIASRVARKWHDIQHRISVIYLAGGGATAIQEGISQIARCEVLENCQFANANGYLFKGMRKESQENSIAS